VAFGIVSVSSVGQQNNQEGNVCVGHKMVEKSRNRPKERSHDLGQIVEMASQTPVAAVEENGGSNALVSAVLGGDKFGWLAPNLDVTVSLSEVNSLSVTVVVDKNASNAAYENK
jgi:hypothetical protein